MTTAPSSLTDIIESLAAKRREHARTTETYKDLDRAARTAATDSGFAQQQTAPVPLPPFGDVVFPFRTMGAVSTLDLFGLDELIIFSFYWTNRRLYRRAADIGANLGLHSILMAKCGWQVTAYEPDPLHAQQLRTNLRSNSVTTVELVEAAVSDRPGQLEFVRVLGNTTSSHLAGAKTNAYGALEKFPVKVESIAAIMPTVDFVKMDAEGQERVIILGTAAQHWEKTDMMVEVGTPENAGAIFQHLQKLGVRAFAQKLGWAEVGSVEQMPASYKDGSLFITKRTAMPWA